MERFVEVGQFFYGSILTKMRSFSSWKNKLQRLFTYYCWVKSMNFIFKDSFLCSEHFTAIYLNPRFWYGALHFLIVGRCSTAVVLRGKIYWQSVTVQCPIFNGYTRNNKFCVRTLFGRGLIHVTILLLFCILLHFSSMADKSNFFAPISDCEKIEQN